MTVPIPPVAEAKRLVATLDVPDGGLGGDGDGPDGYPSLVRRFEKRWEDGLTLHGPPGWFFNGLVAYLVVMPLRALTTHGDGRGILLGVVWALFILGIAGCVWFARFITNLVRQEITRRPGAVLRWIFAPAVVVGAYMVVTTVDLYHLRFRLSEAELTAAAEEAWSSAQPDVLDDLDNARYDPDGGTYRFLAVDRIELNSPCVAEGVCGASRPAVWFFTADGYSISAYVYSPEIDPSGGHPDGRWDPKGEDWWFYSYFD